VSSWLPTDGHRLAENPTLRIQPLCKISGEGAGHTAAIDEAFPPKWLSAALLVASPHDRSILSRENVSVCGRSSEATSSL